MTQQRRRSFPLLFAMLCAAFAAGASGAGTPELEGHPFRGREVFASKGCLRCHSVWRHGGTQGPDITQVVSGKTFYELVGDFWNHTPRMLDAVAQGGYEWPTLERQEMADLLSYLYYLRLFDEPGDAGRGAAVYGRLHCADCHSLGSQGGAPGGPLDALSAYPSSLPLAQAMWNASAEMQREQRARGVRIPEFRGSEMAHLQAYIRAEGLRDGRDVPLLPLPDPARGERAFHEKGCSTCHGGPDAPVDITRSTLSRAGSEITGLLWNHSNIMADEMRRRGVGFPRFSGTELSDLVAYLYFLGYRGVPGEGERGAEVFAQKRCSSCHAGPDGSAPDLMQGQRDNMELATAMWNHAPQMHEQMADQAVSWPKFEAGEMRDLAAYLQSLTKTRDGP